MVYAGIVAGGTGTRMGADIPKQFLNIGGKPIIIHTIEKFLAVKQIDCVLAAVHPDWVEYTEKLTEDYFGKDSRVIVTIGGSDRNATVFNIIDKIYTDFGMNEEDIILTHDAVRPFVTEKIICDNIDCAKNHYACTTAVAAVDTILQSIDGRTIASAPPRDQMFHAQTPQSFNIKKLIAAYEALSDEKKLMLTDTCSIFTVQKLPVQIVNGDFSNIKITTPHDMKLAEALI